MTGLEQPSSIEDYRLFINQIQKKGRNNKKLLWFIRKLSPFYKEYETKNIWHFDMANWFNLISEIRHAIIHNRQSLTMKVQTEIEKNQNKALFERYFYFEKSYATGLIFTNRLKTGEHICLLHQFAFLIFKSLSIEAKLDANYYI